MKRIHIDTDDLKIGEDFYLRLDDSEHYKVTCLAHVAHGQVMATWKDLNQMVTGVVHGADGVWVDREAG
jgi:hypothetical protein